ncbi:MAG: hypothetical protein B6U89_01855 [Desulfurococcales archaeon ex4484_58]|nr:MAG: hypothetical protein B6U89_01855 [Desulfurococcales archaeon ex4484_58]
MKYYREIYILFILIGIIFYIFSIAKIYELIMIIQGFIPIVNVLSEMRFNYKVLDANVTQNNETLHLSLDLSINVTWNAKIDHPGPKMVFMFKGRELGSIDIKNLSENSTNNYVRLKINISREDLNETVYLKVLMNTSIGDFEYIQPIINTSSLLKLVNIGLSINYRERAIYLYSNYRFKANVEIIYYDKSLKILGIQREYIELKPDEQIKVNISPNISIENTKYIGIKILDVEINRFKIGD